MNVLVRHSRNDKGIRHRRHAPFITASRQEDPDASDTAEHQLPTPGDDGSPQRRQLPGPVQDNALYTCCCGYVFEALVSTSVDCPNCGDGQAW